jgi:hypothetical protein
MSVVEDLIHKHLGKHAQEFEYTVGDESRTGFRTSLPGADTEDLSEIEKAAAELRPHDVRVFAGRGGSTLYALPGLPVPDVVELAGTGAHRWPEVRELVARIFARAPFDVVFADEAGFQGVFHASLSEADAREIASWLSGGDHFDSGRFRLRLD